jgi:hypothetical protein
MQAIGKQFSAHCLLRLPFIPEYGGNVFLRSIDKFLLGILGGSSHHSHCHGDHRSNRIQICLLEKKCIQIGGCNTFVL